MLPVCIELNGTNNASARVTSWIAYSRSVTNKGAFRLFCSERLCHRGRGVLRHDAAIGALDFAVLQNLVRHLMCQLNGNRKTDFLVASGDITANSPASHSDLKQGDIILAVNGKPVDDANQLRLQIGMLAPGSTVKLRLLRAGAARDVTVKMGEPPAKEEPVSLDSKGTGSTLEGVSVENLTPEAARRDGVGQEG